jgi:large subunit ribosomal protein L10
MSKMVKQMMIGTIQSNIGEHRDVLVVDASRLDGITANRLRNQLRSKRIFMFTVKNAVGKRALGEIGLEAISGSLTGPSTLVFGGEDIIALARELFDCAKTIKNLEIKGGALGDTALTAPEVEALSKSPGRAEILSQIVQLLLSPGRRLASAIGGPAACVAGQVETVAARDVPQ